MLLPARVPSPFVVAIVATRATAPHSFSSIAQNHPPEALIVIDEVAEVGPELRRVAAESRLANLDVILLQNQRAPLPLPRTTSSHALDG